MANGADKPYGGREEVADAIGALLRDRSKGGVGFINVIDEITPTTIGSTSIRWTSWIQTSPSAPIARPAGRRRCANRPLFRRRVRITAIAMGPPSPLTGRFDQPGDDSEEIHWFKRLAEGGIRPQPPGIIQRIAFAASATRNNEDLDIALVSPDLFDCFESTDAGQPQVRDGEIEHRLAGEFNAGLAVISRLDVVPPLKQGDDETAQQFIVVDYQNAAHAVFTLSPIEPTNSNAKLLPTTEESYTPSCLAIGKRGPGASGRLTQQTIILVRLVAPGRKGAF